MWSFQKSGDLPVGFEFERVSCFYALELSLALPCTICV